MVAVSRGIIIVFIIVFIVLILIFLTNIKSFNSTLAEATENELICTSENRIIISSDECDENSGEIVLMGFTDVPAGMVCCQIS